MILRRPWPLGIKLKSTMLKTLILFISIICGPTIVAESKVVETTVYHDYKRLDFMLSSESLDHSSIPTFFYFSSAFDPKREAKWVLFLHGRGYAREVGAQDSMLEHLDIAHLLIENPQLIFVAPQDIFYHQESDSIGQDYWLGSGKRNWQKFLGEELPEHINSIQNELEVMGRFETVIGISMGAHGALSLGDKFPAQYKNIAALSPIFRPVISEIPTSDYDVFRPQSRDYMMANNMGAKLLERQYSLPQNIFITISQNDFGIDKDRFPMAVKCWEQLLELQSDKSFIEINEDQRGHSAGFWIHQLPRALDFLSLP